MEKQNLYKVVIENKINTNDRSEEVIPFMPCYHIEVPISELDKKGIDSKAEIEKAHSILELYKSYLKQLSSDELKRIPNGKYKISLEVKLEKID